MFFGVEDLRGGFGGALRVAVRCKFVRFSKFRPFSGRVVLIDPSQLRRVVAYCRLDRNVLPSGPIDCRRALRVPLVARWDKRRIYVLEDVNTVGVVMEKRCYP